MTKFFDRNVFNLQFPGEGFLSFWKKRIGEDWEDDIVFKSLETGDVIFSLTGEDLPLADDRILVWNSSGPIFSESEYRGEGFRLATAFPVVWLDTFNFLGETDQKAKVLLETMFFAMSKNSDGLDLSFWTNLLSEPTFPSEEEEGTAYSNDLVFKLNETEAITEQETIFKVMCVARGSFVRGKLLYKGEETVSLFPVFQKPTIMWFDETQNEDAKIPFVDFV